MSRLIRLSLIGAAAFAVCLVALAPASLVRVLVGDVKPLILSTPTGTLWRGAAELSYAGTPLGQLTWSFAPMLLLRGQLGYDVTLRGQNLELQGRASTSTSTAYALLHGTFDATLLAEALARYDITVPGSLTLEGLDMTHPYTSRLPLLRGNLKWSGGAVSYRLSGRDHRVVLPMLVGVLESPSGRPQMTVHQNDDKTPLLVARVTEDGLATIGITKQFTKLLGDPWPGSEPDHAVVLEVGEKLF